jgi:hypothetical protein
MNLEDQPPINQLIGIGLPPLWRTHIHAWFTQAEAYFDLRKITSDSTKINYVILSLSSEVVQEVYDLLSTKYQSYIEFKDALIKRFSKSEHERICQLTAEELGDRTPSELLRRMQSLITDSSLESGIFRQLFLQKLPSNVREILASISDDTSLVNLASIADKILVVRRHELPVVATNSISSSPRLSLQDQINALAVRFDQIATSRSPSLSRTPASPKSKNKCQTRCWYHIRFGKHARKCIPPCDYKKSENFCAQP